MRPPFGSANARNDPDYEEQGWSDCGTGRMAYERKQELT